MENKPRTVKVAIFAMRKSGTTDYAPEFLDVYTYTTIPIVGQYIYISGQKIVGYQVENIVLLSENEEKWDMAVVVSTGIPHFPMAAYHNSYAQVRRTRFAKEARKHKDKEAYENPDEKWQRRKKFFERLSAGETIEQIAEKEKISVGRVRELINEWRGLKQRIYIYEREEEEENNNDQ